jgi:hypothetical protein
MMIRSWNGFQGQAVSRLQHLRYLESKGLTAFDMKATENLIQDKSFSKKNTVAVPKSEPRNQRNRPTRHASITLI